MSEKQNLVQGLAILAGCDERIFPAGKAEFAVSKFLHVCEREKPDTNRRDPWRAGRQTRMSELRFYTGKSIASFAVRHRK